MTDLPAHPEDFDHVALLRHRDTKQSRWVVVPHGQSIEMDDNAQRPWLRENLGTDWHLFAILPQRSSAQWNIGEPEADGVYLCWTDAPPQSFSVQGVRRKDGRWLTSWPVVAWQKYPDAPRLHHD